MTSEPDPGTGLARRGETLPDLSASHRAGAIVSEFVSSIVEEAQARAATIVAAAEEEAAEGRQAALEGAARVRERVNTLSRELSTLLTELRRESEGLAASASVSAPEPAARAELDESVEAQGYDAATGGEGTVAAPYADAENGAPGGSEAADLARRIARMSDDELARTYANAAGAAEGKSDEARAASLRNLVDAAVGEALRRPAFAAARPREAPSLRRRALSRRRRRREAALAELREACERVRQEQLALEPFGN